MNTTEIPSLRAMVWKEAKENAKWAGLGLLGVVIAAAYAISHIHGPGNVYVAFADIWTAIETTLTFAAPTLGLLLGLIQIVPEQRRDLWAFLIHRPASRSTIFCGKAMTGIRLLFLATLVPLLVFVIWMQVPGNFPAPFDWHLALASILAILSGLVFYFAGMLTALRPARWFGSRALPIPTALLCAFLIAEAPTFTAAFVIGLLFLTVVASATWGSFLTAGAYDRQPRAAKFGLGVTISVGLLIVIVTAAAILTSLFPENSVERTWTRYEITNTGRVLSVTTHSNSDEIEAKDLAGQPVTLPARAISANSFLMPQSLQSEPRNSQVLEILKNEGYNSPSRYILLLGTTGPLDSGTIWYYLVRTHQIVAYSLRNYHRIGFLGPHGFVSGDTPQANIGFPESLMMTENAASFGWRSFLVFPHAVYLLHPEAQTVTRVMATDPNNPIRGIIDDSAGYFPGGMPPGGPLNAGFTRLFVSTDHFISVLSPKGNILFTLPKRHDAGGYADVYVRMTHDAKRFFFQYSPPYRSKAPSYLEEVTASGKIVNTETLPALPERPAQPTPRGFALYGLLTPPFLTGALNAIGYLSRAVPDNSLWYAMTHEPEFWILACLCSVIAGLLSSILAWQIARRCVFSRDGQWAWTIGAFWLGLPGVLLLLSLRDWPAREACPNCGRLRVVDRDRCEHCGAGFPPPARDGTEIFDDGEGVPVAVGR